MNKFLPLLLFSLFQLFSSAQTIRKVMVEECTGAWCGGCPAAAIAIENIEGNYPLNCVPLAWHEWDDLEIPEWPAIRDAFGVQSYPAGFVDRYKYPGSTAIRVSHLTFNTHFIERYNIHAIASIALRDPWYDGTQYHFAMDVEFSSAPIAGAPLKMNVYITEDSIPAIGAMEQVNYYTTIQNGNNPLVNWFHNEAVRRGLGGSWGITGPFQSGVTPGVTYSQDFSFAADPLWNIDQLNLVAYVAYDGDTSMNQKQVINAETIRLKDWLNTTGTTSISNPQLKIKVSPNPATLHDRIRISVQLPQSGKIRLEVLNMLGECVSLPYTSDEIAGLHTFEWSASYASKAISSGLYQIRISTDDGIAGTARIVLVEEN